MTGHSHPAPSPVTSSTQPPKRPVKKGTGAPLSLKALFDLDLKDFQQKKASRTVKSTTPTASPAPSTTSFGQTASSSRPEPPAEASTRDNSTLDRRTISPRRSAPPDPPPSEAAATAPTAQPVAPEIEVAGASPQPVQAVQPAASVEPQPNKPTTTESVSDTDMSPTDAAVPQVPSDVQLANPTTTESVPDADMPPPDETVPQVSMDVQMESPNSMPADLAPIDTPLASAPTRQSRTPEPAPHVSDEPRASSSEAPGDGKSGTKRKTTPEDNGLHIAKTRRISPTSSYPSPPQSGPKGAIVLAVIRANKEKDKLSSEFKISPELWAGISNWAARCRRKE
jgi:hypothetical protein